MAVALLGRRASWNKIMRRTLEASHLLFRYVFGFPV